jgi:hypothetical protein
MGQLWDGRISLGMAHTLRLPLVCQTMQRYPIPTDPCGVHNIFQSRQVRNELAVEKIVRRRSLDG